MNDPDKTSFSVNKWNIFKYTKNISMDLIVCKPQRGHLSTFMKTQTMFTYFCTSESVSK